MLSMRLPSRSAPARSPARSMLARASFIAIHSANIRSIVASVPFLAKSLQLFEDSDHRQPLASCLAVVRLQQPIQIRRPRPQLWQRLHAALVRERRLARSYDLADRVPPPAPGFRRER